MNTKTTLNTIPGFKINFYQSILSLFLIEREVKQYALFKKEKNYFKRTGLFAMISLLIATNIFATGNENILTNLVDVNEVTPEMSCADGRDVELQFVGIHNDIPKTLPISDQSTIDSIVVEVVYKGGNPGTSITIQDANANNYSASRQSVGSNAYVYRMTLPATTAITYTNTTNQNKAQSLSAFIFRNSQPGKTVVTEFTTLGGYNNTYTLDFDIPTGSSARNIRLALPISEVTYDNRGLDFLAKAGSVSTFVSKSWGSDGLGFPNGCCMDTVVFNLNDVAADVEKVSVDIMPYTGGGGTQSFVIAATIAVEIFCDEICGNGIDDDNDGLVDCDDDSCGGTTVVASGNAVICSGTSATLSAVASGGTGPYTYQWSHGLGTGDSKSVNPASTTTYTVTVTNAGGCTAVDQVSISVNQSPVANAGADLSICRFTSSNLNATATGGQSPYNYSWSELPGTGNNLEVTPLNSTTYFVTVTSNNGCLDTDEITITVETCVEDCSDGEDNDGDGLVDCDDPDCGPEIDAGLDVNICPGTSAELQANSSGGSGPYSYSWSHGASGSSQTVSPVTSTTYTVTVTAGSGCTAVDQVRVNIVNCSEDCTNNIDDDGDGLVDCDDPDCVAIATPNLNDDVFTTCPGLPFTERVTYNDSNFQNPSFSISEQPEKGSVSIDATGKISITPVGNDCTTEVFTYMVCNQLSGCCAEATVTIHFGDQTDPVLTNVPTDITISCDDVVPSPPVIIAFDECPGVYMDFEEFSDQYVIGACEAYTITRTWTATDLCGNVATDSQVITVVDDTKPEIFQVYTLENGMRIVAGVSKRVSHEWKSVPFPITFDGTPMIFTTVTSNNDFGGVTVRQRNAYSQGFEIKLFEEEATDGLHQSETVAWMAVESGVNDGDLKLEAGRWENIDHSFSTQTFSNFFGSSVGLLASMQSSNDEDPASLRIKDLNNGSVKIKVQEETSDDSETTHGLEHIGYMAFESGAPLIDNKGRAFGETGNMSLTNAWATVALSTEYTKPVVVFGAPSYNGASPINVRVRNVTANSFEVRIQEWDYLDGSHATESVSWIVLEGAIPGNNDFFCSGSGADLQIGVNVFAIDNCDDQAAFGYTETPSVTSEGTLTTRAWMAIDDCGNTNLITRYDTCSTAALEVRSLLNGAYLNSGNAVKMRDDLRLANIIPLEEPFSALPAFSHVVDETPNGIGSDGDNNPLIDSDGDGVPDGYVLICHKPGTPAEKTKIIPESALDGHLGHGDVLGGCNGDTEEGDLPTGAVNVEYRTIADGDWNDNATWENGNKPWTTNINNTTISIEHQVVISSGDLQMKNNGILWITNGGLVVQSGSIIIEESTLVLGASTLEVLAGNFEQSKSGAHLYASNSTIHVSGNFSNLGTRELEKVCLTVYGNHENEGTDMFEDIVTVVNGNYNNKGGATLHAHHFKVHVKTGIFVNASDAVVEGEDLIFWVQNGDVKNDGNWSLTVSQYCAGQSVIGLGGFLPVSEDCSGMADYFNNCMVEDIELIDDTNNGGGSSPTESISAYEVSLNGTLDPSLLTLTAGEAIVDWLLLEIRDADNHDILEYATVALQADGDIISEDGLDIINFPNLIEGDYYVTIRHRNHLPVTTESPVFLSILNPPLIDFTDTSLPIQGAAFGAQSQSGQRLMWGGDFNGDDQVIYQGPNNDVFYLFSRVLGDLTNAEFLANFIIADYDTHDYNLDGKVIYQGPNNDRASMLYHTVLSHTGNSGFLANYIVKGTLP